MVENIQKYKSMKTVNFNLNLKSTGFLIILLLFVQSTFAQGWEKHYLSETISTIWFKNLNYVTPTNDGGALIFTAREQSGTDFLKTIKVDQDGIVQNQTYLNDPIVFSLMHTTASETSDGDFLVAAQSGSDSLLLYKLNQNAVLDWKLSFSNNGDFVNDMRINNTPDGGFLVTTIDETPMVQAAPRVIKIDLNGAVEWDFTYNFPLYQSVESSLSIVVNPNNSYSLSFYEEIYNPTSFNNKVVLLDSIGQVVSDQTLVEPQGQEWETLDAVKFNQGGMKILIEEQFSESLLLMTTDSVGNYISDDTLLLYPPIYETQNASLINTFDGGVLVYSTVEDLVGTRYTVAAKLGPTNNLEWTKLLTGEFDRASASLTEGSYFFFGITASNDIRVVKLDAAGSLYGNFIVGNVLHDLNQNCLIDPNELSLQNWYVEAAGNTSFYGLTDSLGNYSIEVATGTYDVNVLSPGSLWSACPNNSVQVNSLDTIRLDLLMKSQFDCPYLTLDVSTPFLRRCFNNTYSVSFCNQGTVASPINTIDLTFHPHFDVISSTIPWSSQSGTTYTFSVGNLNVNECGSFYVDVIPNCDSTILGQALCVNASILPDSICAPPSSSWDGSITDLEVVCGTDSLTFTIKNIGLGNMGTPQEYFVIEDNFITKQGNFALASLDSKQLKFPANGSTYRLFAGQAPGYFPVGYHPTIAYEGCGTNSAGTYSTGFINMFPLNNSLNTESTDCQPLIGSFDPNDKQAFPEGYGPEHYIEAGVDLEYHIRFQNTGTDTAFTVVIRDTISDHLDMASLLQGTSSHPYRLEIINGNVLKFTFNDILLPDSTTNEPGSHGFVKFKIGQQANLPLGTTIFNSAGIYFDFNEPIITNETWHEIGEDFIPVMVTSVENAEYPNLNVRVQPNPFVTYTQFVLEHAPEGNKVFELYDALGKLVTQEPFSDDSTHRFYKRQLSSGIYFYKILNNNQLLTSGKLIAGHH